MSRIMIRCPSTGKPLFTGMGMNAQSFANSQFVNNTVGPCPHCGQSHVWNKKDAWVEDDPKAQ